MLLRVLKINSQVSCYTHSMELGSILELTSQKSHRQTDLLKLLPPVFREPRATIPKRGKWIILRALFFLIRFQSNSQKTSHAFTNLLWYPLHYNCWPHEGPIPTTFSLSTHSSPVFHSLYPTLTPWSIIIIPSLQIPSNHLSSLSLPLGKLQSWLNALSALSVPVPNQLKVAGEKSHNQADGLHYIFMIDLKRQRHWQGIWDTHKRKEQKEYIWHIGWRVGSKGKSQRAGV